MSNFLKRPKAHLHCTYYYYNQNLCLDETNCYDATLYVLRIPARKPDVTCSQIYCLIDYRHEFLVLKNVSVIISNSSSSFPIVTRITPFHISHFGIIIKISRIKNYVNTYVHALCNTNFIISLSKILV